MILGQRQHLLGQPVSVVQGVGEGRAGPQIPTLDGEDDPVQTELGVRLQRQQEVLL